MASSDRNPISSMSSANDNADILPLASPTLSTDSVSLDGQPTRPGLGNRDSSGSIAPIKTNLEEYDEDELRTMSPKRSPEDIERLSSDARQHLIEQARQLQSSLMAIVDRVETIKEEHDKLEGGNKFLQQYIGELIQTTKITSSSKGRGGRK